MMRVRSILFLIAVLAPPLAVVQAEGHSLAALVAENEDLTTLQSLIVAAGPGDALAAEGPLTLYAPVNEAFAALPDFALNWLLENPDQLSAVIGEHLNGDMTDAVAVADPVEADNGRLQLIDSLLLPGIELAEVVPAFVDGDIIVAGSSTVFPLSDAIATRFRDEGYAGNITVDSIGSGAGFERFCAEGVTDVANASRPIRDAEVENCRAIGRSAFPIRVGTDALAVVVNRANYFADSLTLEELARLFSTADTWQDVNADWPAQPIERFIPGTDSGTFDYFAEEVFDRDQARILDAARTSLSEDDNVLVKGVSGNPYAVGFFGYAYFEANREILNAVPIEGVAPAGSSVDDGSYPLARPLFLYAAPEIIAGKPQVGDFLVYYLSVVNDEVEAAGYFPADAAGLNLARLLVAAATGG
ncbi:MAG: substrate-binding domain-containing protein [Anaerolineaceae bacterium]|nr:substrate-binding domain-containing protein [Anaerolineaceae bacterium]MDE0330171.1 substrate-binding domain-containing protein [Anaerolineaceae bacterium]